MSAAQVIQVLDQTVDWYRTLGIQQQAANEPSDLLILYDNRQTANKLMALAFDIARADADLLSKEPPTTQDTGGDSGVSSQALLQLQKKLDTQGRSVQSELDARKRELATAPKKSKIEVQAKINELQGELDLVNTKKNILNTMAGFATGAGASSAGALKAQIDAMAVAIPSASAASTTSNPAATAAPAGTSSTPSLIGPAIAAPTVGRFGLWDLASNAFRLSEKASTLTSIDQRTATLQSTLARIRTPLIDQIKALSARGDALAAQADSADSATLNGVHDQLDALSEQFKQASALLIPLSREGVLLSQYRRNLSNWHDAIEAQYRDAIKMLGIRLGVVLVVLALVFGAAELWRRMVLRYIQDSRRRYQLLLLRRIALWSLVVIVIGISFASELGSIVTFAGLITAGIAVAMQSVLVSIVGYFFLIGKYGIRVGDRVQIGDVAGEVIDLGLVRMYLMELGVKGTMGPTGRVVAFANSVVFQVSSGLFKQIPGVNFSWREVILNLPPGSDYAAIKEKLIAVVTEALKDYRAEILRQTKEIARTTSSNSAGDAQPQVQLHFSAAGVEAHVRYPVHLQHAADIDERVTEALANVVSNLTAVAGSRVTARSG
ncbi:MAG TPA: mechanosensitive ion channel domain-containing protein [Steroidobacteraceae bacterium]|nr:mechanosensitive ion channel domain-containing protein [Steroidobacteraceae bacterium]